MKVFNIFFNRLRRDRAGKKFCRNTMVQYNYNCRDPVSHHTIPQHSCPEMFTLDATLDSTIYWRTMPWFSSSVHDYSGCTCVAEACISSVLAVLTVKISTNFASGFIFSVSELFFSLCVCTPSISRVPQYPCFIQSFRPRLRSAC